MRRSYRLFPVWQIFPIQYAGVVVYLEDHAQNIQTMDNILGADLTKAKGGIDDRPSWSLTNFDSH